jgi:hypothetical protein
LDIFMIVPLRKRGSCCPPLPSLTRRDLWRRAPGWRSQIKLADEM